MPRAEEQRDLQETWVAWELVSGEGHRENDLRETVLASLRGNRAGAALPDLQTSKGLLSCCAGQADA